MNERLAEFLMWLVRDPERLEAFNDDDAARSTMVQQADLSDAEREALLSGDSTAILALLQAGTDEGLTWVAIPGIKVPNDGIPRIKFTVGFAVFGIKGSRPITQAASARTSKTAKTATRPKGSVRAGTKRRSASSKSKSARSAKSRSAAKRRR